MKFENILLLFIINFIILVFMFKKLLIITKCNIFHIDYINLSMISNSVVLFSGFYDKRYNSIRIIGGIKNAVNLTCYIINNSIKQLCKCNMIIYKKDSSGTNFKSLYMNILIPLSNTAEKPKTIYLNNTKLHIFYSTGNIKRNVVCITTIKYFQSYKLLLQSLFIFYQYGITDIFLYSSDFNFYIHKLKITFKINIHLIYIENSIYLNDMFYFGQVVKYNDCLYRNMYTSNYIIFIDYDEVITLKKNKSYLELLNYNKSGDIFYIRSAICPTTKMYIENKRFHRINDSDIRKTLNCCILNSYYHRKYIIKSPYKFIKINIHYVDYVYERVKHIYISSTYAHIHHSRISTFLLINHCTEWFKDISLSKILQIL